MASCLASCLAAQKAGLSATSLVQINLCKVNMTHAIPGLNMRSRRPQRVAGVWSVSQATLPPKDPKQQAKLQLT